LIPWTAGSSGGLFFLGRLGLSETGKSQQKIFIAGRADPSTPLRDPQDDSEIRDGSDCPKLESHHKKIFILFVTNTGDLRLTDEEVIR
jgi:hypothetical protein